MSRGAEDLREQVRQHLLFCREMGIDALDLARAGAPQGAPGMASQETPEASAAPPGPAPVEEDRAPRAAALERLRTEEIGDCRRCKLCSTRRTIVFGTGDAAARLMFVGEGPGHDEDVQGLPFVGKAGQLLNQIIQAMGFRREQVYIANVVKCRPPDNRTPQPDETAACTPFLFTQIEIIRPRAIVALGSPAAQALLETSAGITKIRGTFRTFRSIPVMPTFHPAYLLRNPAAKKDVWEDMKQVMALLRGD